MKSTIIQSNLNRWRKPIIKYLSTLPLYFKVTNIYEDFLQKNPAWNTNAQVLGAVISTLCPNRGGRSRGYTYCNLYNPEAPTYFKEWFDGRKIIWKFNRNSKKSACFSCEHRNIQRDKVG